VDALIGLYGNPLAAGGGKGPPKTALDSGLSTEGVEAVFVSVDSFI
jgi:hypothetical protein